MAVSIVDANGHSEQLRRMRGKTILIYVMEFDRASTLVVMMGRITSTGKPARDLARAVVRQSLDAAPGVSTSHCART
jgi:uncharacterized protein GlcG (DUF336 family)